MICHCSGLVSCASSTRMWSIPPSILNSTHAAAPAREQERLRLDDQVVIVERGLARFGARVLCLHGVGEQEHRRARLGAARAARACRRARRSGLARASSSGARLRRGLPKALLHRIWRGLFSSVRNIGFECRDALAAPAPPSRAPQGCALSSCVRAGLPRRCLQALRAARRSRYRRAHRQAARRAPPRSRSSPSPNRRLRQRSSRLVQSGSLSCKAIMRASSRALAEHGVDDLAEIVLDASPPRSCRARLPSGPSRSAAARAIVASNAAPFSRKASRLIEHGEMRRDLRLERKALQQPLAEAVDGVDLEAAFGFERAGRRGGAPRCISASPAARPSKRRESLPASSSVRQRRPGGKLAEQRGSASRPPRSWCRSGRGCARAASRQAAAASTRLTSTWVLPVPALADTQAERRGVGGARLVGVGLVAEAARARAHQILLLGLLRRATP